MRAAQTGRIHGCTRPTRQTSDSSCNKGAVHTWQILLKKSDATVPIENALVAVASSCSTSASIRNCIFQLSAVRIRFLLVLGALKRRRPFQDFFNSIGQKQTLTRVARSAIAAKKAAPSELTVSEPPQFVKTGLKTKSHQTTAGDVASRSAQALQSHAGGGPRTSAAFNPPSPKEFDIV